jgi:uncharacterized protein YgbK (DUF1537 family)
VAASYFLAFGNQAAPPELASLAPVLERLTGRTGLGFMAACFAAPALGRTVYQGHLFQGGKHVANLRTGLAGELSGRVAVIPYEIIAEGPAAIRRQLAACREQGVALALLDAIDPPQCAAIADALAGQILTAGPAWLAQVEPAEEPPAPAGRLAILSGALDRQTLYQIGAARAALPFLQLDLSGPDPIAAALAWSAAQPGEILLIAASAPPGLLTPNAPAAEILAAIGAGLAAAGTRNFLITGNDTASIILNRLGVTTLTAGAAAAGLRWLGTPKYNFLLKPGGFGDQKLFLGQFGPHIRLNAAAE